MTVTEGNITKGVGILVGGLHRAASICLLQPVTTGHHIALAGHPVARRGLEHTVVDGLLIKSFSLHGGEGGSGILILEDGTEISFANQEVTVIGGYSAFHTEAENPHTIDFIMANDCAMSVTDLPSALRFGANGGTEAEHTAGVGTAPELFH